MRALLCLPLLLLSVATAAADEPLAPALVKNIDRPEVTTFTIGGASEPILAAVHRDDADLATSKFRIALVGSDPAAAKAVAEAMTWFFTSEAAEPLRDRFVLSAVPAFRSPKQTEPSQFPPPGTAYNNPQTAPEHYLWRWLGMHAPDLVVEVRSGEQRAWSVPSEANLSLLGTLAKGLRTTENSQPGSLVAAVASNPVANVGKMPGVQVTVGQGQAFLPALLEVLAAAEKLPPSPARLELRQRADRTPRQVAEQLSKHYGQSLPQVVYIPALALIGRLELSELTGEAEHAAAVRRIVGPYVRGEKGSEPNNGSGLSGHLLFAELAARSDGDERERYLTLAKAAADLALDANGQPRKSMPYHSEMSDALFMGGPILAQVGRLTGNERYFDACLQHLKFMRGLTLRDDGLYRHSPLDEAAWGRGNGFPALGVAMCLTQWPEDRPDRDELLAMFRGHMQALAQHQDATGCWHQVIDRPGSYRELTCTAMITWAMARGVRSGWLDREDFDPIVRRGWQAVKVRVGADGGLVDVCTGTGKQRSLADYYHRPAILGRDDRGGAMALLVSLEMARYLE